MMGTCMSREAFEIDIPYIQVKESSFYYEESAYRYHYCKENAGMFANKGEYSLPQEYCTELVKDKGAFTTDHNTLNTGRKQTYERSFFSGNSSGPDYIQTDSEVHQVASKKHSRAECKESATILDYIVMEAYTFPSCNEDISLFQSNTYFHLVQRQPTNKCSIQSFPTEEDSKECKDNTVKNFIGTGCHANVKIPVELIFEYNYIDKLITMYRWMKYNMTESPHSLFKNCNNLYQITARYFNKDSKLTKRWCADVYNSCKGLNLVKRKDYSKSAKEKSGFMQEGRFPLVYIDRGNADGDIFVFGNVCGFVTNLVDYISSLNEETGSFVFQRVDNVYFVSNDVLMLEEWRKCFQ